MRIRPARSSGPPSPAPESGTCCGPIRSAPAGRSAWWGPDGQRISLYGPRGGWDGPPPFEAGEVTELARSARHVHVSIMDSAAALLGPLRAGTTGFTALSTDLHDWDGVAGHHRPFAAAADLILVSAVRLGQRRGPMVAELVGAPPIRTVVVTEGARGSVMTGPDTPGVRVAAAVPPATVVDTNGAGDAFVAGMIAGRLRGLAPVEAARYAARVAAAACTHDGMRYPPGLLPAPPG